MGRVSKETVYRKMEEDSLCYWQVFDGKAKVDENQTNENINESIDNLRNILDDIEGNSVNVKISNRNSEEKAKGGRNYIHYEYTVKLTAPRPEANGNLSLLQENFNLKLQLELLKITTANEARILELTKKDKDSPADRALTAMLPKILEAFGGKVTPGIAGMNEEVTEANLSKANVKQALKNIINQLAKADKDYIEVLAAIATIAKDKPTEYATYRPLLISMAGGGK